jgi:SpoIID/LytB domain protein
MLLRFRRSRRVIVTAAALALLLPAGIHPRPTAAAQGLQLSGHGWGHGRGMGQYGALGYAIDKSQSSDWILDHFYGGTTAGSVSPTALMTVRITALDNQPTIVVQERGHMTTSVDGGTHGGIKIERVSANSFRVSDGSYCGGPWTPRAGLVSASSVEVSPTMVNDDRQEMLQLCVPGGTRWLRGSIRAVEGNNAQQTVNALGTDAYVRGVVPRESPASWGDLGGGKGMQALKAQAVAARSYATAGGYAPYAKTCDTTACQVYGGRAQQINGQYADLEDPRTDNAVAQTAGQVRMLNGSVARTEFSSSTGGYTAGGTFPAVPDDGDATASNPNHNWTATVDTAAIENQYKRGTFQSATVTSRNGLGADGGRVLTMRLNFPGGSVDVAGTDFQSAFGLKSNWFLITSQGPVFSGFEYLGGTLRSGPAAASWLPGRLDVFIQGTDNALWHKWYASGWSSWETLGGGLSSAPAVTAPAGGALDVFVRGTDNAIYLKRFDGAGWHDWEYLGGATNDAPGATSVNGKVYVFVRGTDNALWYRVNSGGNWSGWNYLGGGLSSGPTAAAWPSGQLHVFIRGTDNALWHIYTSGGGWSGWEYLAGNITTGPGAAAWGNDRVDVFARGTDNALWHRWWDGKAGGWSYWTYRGGTLTAAPGASSWGVGRLDVVVRGTDNALWHSWSG